MAVFESNASLPENKPTRQWDAWTREEEENFFGALRQVGKNFEKITSRVQTKNKDQVRHYYYRVIKRMNKILSPSLVLDAKNSSYVNSAMLRWWSLLEKHSCSASKLRLKPRRFKTFVTALEHQLLKDRKKPKKKSPPSASSKKPTLPTEASDGISIESGECTTSGVASSKASLEELQSSQSVVASRRTAVKRKATNNASKKSSTRSEAKRPPRPRKKPSDGKRSKAANAELEKEGNLGVANAVPELLERDAGAEGILPDSDSSNTNCKSHPRGNDVIVDPRTGQISSATSAAFSKLVLLDKLPSDHPCLRGRPRLVNVVALAGPSGATSATPPPSSNAKDTWPPLEIIPDLSFEAQKSLALLGTRCNNCSSLRCTVGEEMKSDSTDAKVKLQLFPFDDNIRKALEQDGLNPHLELTLKARKSISSVLNHLTQKWGRSSIASGELRLFPFNTQWSSLASRKSWSYLDSNVSAAEVHATLGNPAVFRLRYAWIPSRVLESSPAVLQQVTDTCTDVLCPVKVLPVGGSCSEFSKSVPVSAATIEAIAQLPPRLPSKFGSTIGEDCLSARTEIPSIAPAYAPSNVNSSDTSAIPVLTSSKSQGVEAEDDAELKECASFEAVEGNSEIGRRSSVTSVSPVIHGEAEVIVKAASKLQDGAAQLSGCGWMYESTDGFAQQLWTLEDSLRSNHGVSMAQMDWVDSLTNISVSELLGDGVSRHDFPGCAQQNGVDQPHLTSQMDSFDISLSVQQSHMEQPSIAIWGGEETCDAFSFQKAMVSDQSIKQTVNPLNHETSLSSLGLDMTFRNIAPLCWREQLQSSQNQDLLFGGEASIGLSGLIEALAGNGSLDGFQTEPFSQLSDELNVDTRVKQEFEVMGKTKEGNDEAWDVAPKSLRVQVSPSIGNVVDDSTSLVDNFADIRSDLLEGAKNDEGQENTEFFVGTKSSPIVSVQDGDSDVPTRSASCRPQRQKDRRQASGSPPRPFKLNARYTNMRSLKLQT
ncbi:protein Mp1R-MYB4 [Marchantia polymorpha subsp. ruderalis]